MIIEIEQLVNRYGEVVVQAIVENLERYEGVRSEAAVSLEQRWQRLMQNAPVAVAA